MEKLPLEIVAQILGYLDLPELINCRAVCRGFLAASYQVQIGDLMINGPYSKRPLWFHTNRPKYYGDVVSQRCFVICKSICGFGNRLRRLNLKSCSLKYSLVFTQAVLRGLDHLKQLEIWSELFFHPVNHKIQPKARCKFNLPSLEILLIDGRFDFLIDLTAPRLIVAKVGRMDQIRIRQPNSLKQLYVKSLAFPKGLGRFQNLELLSLDATSLYMFDWVMQDFLLIQDELIALRCLKSLHFTMLKRCSWRKDEWEDFKENLKHVHRQKTMQRGQEFKIYNEGVELVDFDRECEFDETSHRARILKFQIENPDLLQEDLSEFREVEYSNLMKLKLRDSLLSAYFETNLYITDVLVNRHFDPKLLLKFLNRLKFLNHLSLSFYNCYRKVDVDAKAFFEQLHAPALRLLKICGLKKNFNAEVLLKFDELLYLETDNDIKLEQALNLIKNFKHLHKISVYKDSYSTSILKLPFSNKFEVGVNINFLTMYKKVCFNFDQIRAFHSLVTNRRNVFHWIKVLSLISFRYVLKFLHIDHLVDGRLFNCDFAWYRAMLAEFTEEFYRNIIKDLKELKKFLNRL